MSYELIVGFAVAIFVSTCVLIMKLTRQKSDSIPLIIITTGCAVIIAALPKPLLIALDTLRIMLGITPPSSQSPTYTIFSFVTGIILILIGLHTRNQTKNRIHILNMLGFNKHEICDPKNTKALGFAEHKIREYYIDFMHHFNDGNLNASTSKYIVATIKEEVLRFNHRSIEFTRYFTGTAPIPYTILAGTFLDTGSNMGYLECNRFKGNVFYALSKKGKSKKKRICQTMEIADPVGDKLSTDVVVAVSVTFRVQEADLERFTRKGYPIINFSVENPAHNIINDIQQLNEYIEVIVRGLENLRTTFPSLQTIHLACAIPSCISIELGRRISASRNMMPRIISYHFKTSEKYTFGIVMTGDGKGKFIPQNI